MLDSLPIPEPLKYRILSIQRPGMRMIALQRIINGLEQALEKLEQKKQVASVPTPSYRGDEEDIID